MGVLLIGLIGKKRSGKDEFIKAVSNGGSKVLRHAFADALKTELADACGVTVDDIENDKARFRLGLQWWGTEFRRTQDSQYWIKRWKSAFGLISMADNDLVIAVPDVRFENEAQVIKEHGGVLVRIHRDSSNTHDFHSSETVLDAIYPDHIIHNTGTLAEYHGRCVELFNYLWQTKYRTGSM